MKKIQLILVGQGGGGGGMGGGMGSMIAGIVQGVTGIGQMIGGAVKSAKAKKLMPEETDPTQVAMVDALRRTRMGYQTGSEASVYKNTVNQGLSNSVDKAAALSGGNTGGLLAAITGAQANAGEAYNQIAATLEKNRMGAFALEKQATDDVAQRRLDIKMARYLQAMGDAESLKKAGAQNFGASFNTFSGGSTSGDATGGAANTDTTGNSVAGMFKKKPQQSGGGVFNGQQGGGGSSMGGGASMSGGGGY